MQTDLEIRTDYLVIGSGLAGLFFSLKAARNHKVLLITKAYKQDSNTWYAQGGIAGVFGDDDSIENHVHDTLIAGDGLCDEKIVRIVAGEGPERIQELMQLGVRFDRSPDGELELGMEGGHSHHRILHNKDATGQEISRALLMAAGNHPNITIVEHLFAVDLLTQHHLGVYVNRGHPNITCFGVYALNTETHKVHKILAKVTVLASGGSGNVYSSTTNPPTATGDGIAMALRAKARIADMEFYQFHPTALYDPGSSPSFLITEALRGKGAYLRDFHKKERFMNRYDSRLELAPRDIVARAIDNEMKLSGSPHVWLDARHIPLEDLIHEFPTIYKKCLSKGIDLSNELIPVVPAAHYQCGGIDVNENGQTSILHLYAIGECSCTGLHGANRLASNSLLEAIVFAHRAFDVSSDQINSFEFQTNIPEWNSFGAEKPEEWALISNNFKEVQNIMSNYVGIVRTNLRLERAERRIELIYLETNAFYQKTRLSRELCELRNVIAIAYLIIKCAKIRKESRGLHATIDYPNTLKVANRTLL